MNTFFKAKCKKKVAISPQSVQEVHVLPYYIHKKWFLLS